MSYEYWPVEYAVDAIDVLYEMENKVPKFLFQSPQFSSRLTLVEWILQLCEQFKLGCATAHLAVYILDRFMDGHSILSERLNLTVLACLQLSAKFEERDVCAPKISELSALVNNQYQRADFILFESFILKFLDWKLSKPTAFKFVEFFSLVAVSPSEYDPKKYSSFEAFWYEVQQAIKDYLSLSLQDSEMLEYKPSIVACCSIIMARRQLKLKPLWTRRLARVTRYTFDDLSRCASVLLSFSVRGVRNVKRKLTESPDQGYDTEGSSNCTPPPKKIRSYPNPKHKCNLSLLDYFDQTFS